MGDTVTIDEVYIKPKSVLEWLNKDTTSLICKYKFNSAKDWLNQKKCILDLTNPNIVLYSDYKEDKDMIKSKIKLNEKKKNNIKLENYKIFTKHMNEHWENLSLLQIKLYKLNEIINFYWFMCKINRDNYEILYSTNGIKSYKEDSTEQLILKDVESNQKEYIIINSDKLINLLIYELSNLYNICELQYNYLYNFLTTLNNKTLDKLNTLSEVPKLNPLHVYIFPNIPNTNVKTIIELNYIWEIKLISIKEKYNIVS